MPAFDEQEHAAVADAGSPVEFADATNTLRLLGSWLPSLGVASLAEIIGMSTHQLQQLQQEGGPSPLRLQLVTQLVAILRHTWTDQGVYAWFHRQRLELDGHAPIALLDDTDRERDLLLMARGGRLQVGS
jgi:hypothetical protein